MTKGVPVLMYHAVQDAQKHYRFSGLGEFAYILSRDTFLQQMEFLKRQNIETYSFKKHDEMIPGHNAVVLTFDDGHESNYSVALPILEKYGCKAIFFITTGWIGRKDYLKPQQIRALHDAGMSIGSHGVTHRYFNDLSTEEIKREMLQSRQRLQDITGYEINLFSAPGGRVDKRTISIGRDTGYSFFFTSYFGLWRPGSSTKCIPRIPVKRQVSISAFDKLVHCNPYLLYSLRSRTLILAIFKLILGNRVYDFFWQKLRGPTSM